VRNVAALAVSLAVALAHPPRTHAEGDSREAQLRAEIVSIKPAMPGEFQWALFGQLVGDTDRAESATSGQAQVAAGAEIALASDLCRLVVAGGQLHLFQQGGSQESRRGASGEQWASACLFSGNGLPLIELGHHLEFSLRPALDSRLDVRPDRYSRETITWRVIGLNYEERDLRVEIANWNIDVGFLWQPGQADDLTTMRTTFAGEMFRWVRPGRGLQGDDRALGILPMDMQMTITGSDATTMRVGAVRLQQYKLGPLPLYLDADVAWAHGSVWLADEQTTEYEQIVDADLLAADTSLRFGTGNHSGGLRYERSLTPTVDLELVAEDRVSAWAQLRGKRADLTLHGFVASSLILSQDARRRIPTGGVRAAVDWPLGKHFHASLHAEAARSFYAVLDSDRERGAGWAARLVGALSTRFGSSR